MSEAGCASVYLKVPKRAGGYGQTTNPLVEAGKSPETMGKFPGPRSVDLSGFSESMGKRFFSLAGTLITWGSD